MLKWLDIEKAMKPRLEQDEDDDAWQEKVVRKINLKIGQGHICAGLYAGRQAIRQTQRS